jgi:hypothetical protein
LICQYSRLYFFAYEYYNFSCESYQPIRETSTSNTSEVIRKEVEIPEIQDVRSKYKRNWINHLERMDNTRLPNTPSTTNLEEEGIVAPQETMATR